MSPETKVEISLSEKRSAYFDSSRDETKSREATAETSRSSRADCRTSPTSPNGALARRTNPATT